MQTQLYEDLRGKTAKIHISRDRAGPSKCAKVFTKEAS